jgi:hypothetical protein
MDCVCRFNSTGKDIARVWLHSADTTRANALYVSVRHERGVLATQLPVIVDHVYAYNTAAHTLCPFDDDEETYPLAGGNLLTVEVSALVDTPVSYSLAVRRIDSIDVQ